MTNYAPLIVLAVAVSTGGGRPPAASLAPLDGPPAAQFRTNVDMVELNVTVTDQHEHLVRGLSRDDFLVLEEGIPQQVTFFADQNVPLDLVVMVDTSSSMRYRMPLVKKAAAGFLRTLRPGDVGSVVEFNDHVNVIQPRTGDVAALLASLAGLYGAGETSLYSSIYVELQELAKRSPAEHQGVRRSAVVVLTDGADTDSALSYDDLLEVARRANVAVYPIVIGSRAMAGQPAGTAPDWNLDVPDRVLYELARDSGARAFFPQRIDDLSSVYADIARELATQYSLAYELTTRPEHPVYRHIVVRVPKLPNVRPRTRMGFYAGHDDQRLGASGRG